MQATTDNAYLGKVFKECKTGGVWDFCVLTRHVSCVSDYKPRKKYLSPIHYPSSFSAPLMASLELMSGSTKVLVI